jgi:hypothetical protein
VAVFVSYGGKDAKKFPALADVLAESEAAMDYGKKDGRLELYYFNGTANVKALAQDPSGQTEEMAGYLGSATENALNIFGAAVDLPVLGDIFGFVFNIYKAVDTLNKPESARGAVASVQTYYSRIHLENDKWGVAEQAIGTVNSLQGAYGLAKDLRVMTGDNILLYMDLGTWVQQTADGYSIDPPPQCYAEAKLVEAEGFKPYCKLYWESSGQ